MADRPTPSIPLTVCPAHVTGKECPCPPGCGCCTNTPAARPTADVLPIDRLRNLIDRACRHLTPQEANALRGAAAGTMRNATTAVEGLHQQLAELGADLERAREVAVQLENENARLEAEHTQFVLRAGERIGQAEALAELRRRDLDALREEHDVHRKALAHAIGSTLCRNWDQLIEAAGRLNAAATAWMADTKTATARAERAEQQLAQVRAYADALCAEDHPGHDHVCPDDVRSGLLAALDAPAGPECTDPPRCDNCHETPCPDWCDGPHHDTETPR